MIATAASAVRPTSPSVFPIAPAPAGTRVLALVFTLPAVAGLWFIWRDPGAPAFVRALVTASVLLVAGVLVVTARGSAASRLELAGGALRLRGDVYARAIPLADVDAAGARLVDLDAERGLRPRLRTFGTALPGYQAGWFRLADGRKALLALTARRRAVLVPTTRGYALLVSPADPEGFLAALAALAPAR